MRARKKESESGEERSWGNGTPGTVMKYKEARGAGNEGSYPTSHRAVTPLPSLAYILSLLSRPFPTRGSKILRDR